MKTKTLLLMLALGCMAYTAQAATNVKALRTDSLANVLIKDKKYEDAIKMLNRTVSALDENHPDSLYIQSFVKMGYCYDCLENPMKSIEMTKLAILLRESAGAPENIYLANLYDNIALAYHKIDQNQEARLWSQKTLQITDRFPSATEAQIRHLSHATLIYKALEETSQAIGYQERVVGVVEKSKGKYSDLHLEHLSTLRSLYSVVGDTASYNRAAQQIRQLKEEISTGVLPPKTELTNARQCRQHNQEALLCCRWILGNYVNTKGMKEAVDYLSQYYRHTPDAAVYVGKAESEWAKKLNSVYLMAYIAASCDYALRNPDDLRYSVLQYKYAINRVLDYYKENTRITGTIPTLDSYLRQREHTPEKFDKLLSANFAAFCDQMKTRRPHEFDVEAPTIMQFSY